MCEDTGRGVSYGRRIFDGVYLDGGDPLCTLLGSQRPPFAADRGVGAVYFRSYGLPEYGSGSDGESRKAIDEHS